MPFKLTKGDLARQPAICAEIVALRAKRKAAQHRLFYLNTKAHFSDDEVTEKGQLEVVMVECDTAVKDLHQKVKSTTSADLNEIAATAATDHKVTQAAMDASVKNSAVGLKQALQLQAAVARHVKTLTKGGDLDNTTRVCHDKEGRTNDRMLIATNDGAMDEDGSTDEDGAMGDDPTPGAEATAEAVSRDVVRVDAVAAKVVAKAVVASKRKARVRKAIAPGHIGGFVHLCPCGWGSDHKGSYTKHTAKCSMAADGDYWPGADTDEPPPKVARV